MLLSLCRRDVADGFQQPAIVEPIDPFQRCELDGVERPPRPAPMDDLGFGETVDGLGQSIVVAVAHAAHRRFDTGVGQTLVYLIETYWADSSGRRNRVFVG